MTCFLVCLGVSYRKKCPSANIWHPSYARTQASSKVHARHLCPALPICSRTRECALPASAQDMASLRGNASSSSPLAVSLQVKPGSQKSFTLYTHADASYVVSLASGMDGQGVVCGHLDGTIYRVTFPQVRWCAARWTRQCLLCCLFSDLIP